MSEKTKRTCLRCDKEFKSELPVCENRICPKCTTANRKVSIKPSGTNSGGRRINNAIKDI